MINLIYTILTILCLGIGFYFGYKLGKTEKLPTVNPIKIAEKIEKNVNDLKETKKEQKKINKLNDILENINTYDGTGKNQKPIKK